MTNLELTQRNLSAAYREAQNALLALTAFVREGDEGLYPIAEIADAVKRLERCMVLLKKEGV